MFRRRHKSYIQLLSSCHHLWIKRHSLHLITFAYLFPRIHEQSITQKPYELMLGEMYISVYTYEDGWLDGWECGSTHWAMGDIILDLFSYNQGKLGGWEQKILGGASIVITVPGIVMYGKVSQTGLMKLMWTTCLCWAHSTQDNSWERGKSSTCNWSHSCNWAFNLHK